MATYTPYEKNQSSFFRRLRNRRRKGKGSGGGGAPPSPAFKITIDTTQAGSASDTFILPCAGGGYNALVEWGDGQSEQITLGPVNVTHVYSSGGTYQISITGTFPRIYFNGTGDRDKLISIDNWGDIEWTSFQASFHKCSNLIYVSNSPAPVLTRLNITFTLAFRLCTSLTNISFSGWDMTNVIDFSSVLDSNAALESAAFGNNTENITTYYALAYNCTLLKASFARLKLDSATDLGNFVTNGNINETGTTTNYDDTLVSWGGQTVNAGLTTNFGTSTYSPTGLVGRDLLTGQGWTITDGGEI